MSLPDSTASAALSADIIKPIWFAWLDFAGDPVRTNTSGSDITPAGTGDDDLDAFTFIGISGTLVDVSPVKFAAGGSESVTAKLSGIPGLDDDMLALIDNPANWRGRDARMWRVIRNAANVQQGGYQAYYTGKMVNVRHGSGDGGQTIEVTIESYLSVLSEASNRTYMDQERFDSGDQSARAAIAIANGNFGRAPSGTPVSTPGEGWRGQQFLF